LEDEEEAVASAEEGGTPGDGGCEQERWDDGEADVKDSVPNEATEVGEPSSEGPEKVKKFQGRPGEVVEFVEKFWNKLFGPPAELPNEFASTPYGRGICFLYPFQGTTADLT
jgi:hypothetical protein